ncbi:MAG: glycoside hydrolase family 3 N-terminal domain-containing protein [Pseudomonadota bacterium]
MTPGAYILGCAGTVLSADEAAFFRVADPWGFILFARNIEAPDQVRGLVVALREAVGRDAPVLIDQEGGRVQRMTPPAWREWLPPLDFVHAAGAEAERALFLRYRVISSELRELGIDVNCVPCLDIASAGTHPFLANRCLGGAADDVIARGRAVAEGCLKGGVLPVIKHVPGHGRGTVDSHHEVPRTDADAAVLAQTDFRTFQALADLPLGMTGHVVFTAIDPEHPATTSRAVQRIIREDIGFDGLLMTDDLSMDALGGSMADRTRAALLAGCDVILHCNGEMVEMEAVAEEAGHLTPEGAGRAGRALAAREAAAPIDIAAAEAELDALLQGTS